MNTKVRKQWEQWEQMHTMSKNIPRAFSRSLGSFPFSHEVIGSGFPATPRSTYNTTQQPFDIFRTALIYLGLGHICHGGRGVSKIYGH